MNVCSQKDSAQQQRQHIHYSTVLQKATRPVNGQEIMRPDASLPYALVLLSQTNPVHALTSYQRYILILSSHLTYVFVVKGASLILAY
jgi:hypothetical protein